MYIIYPVSERSGEIKEYIENKNYISLESFFSQKIKEGINCFNLSFSQEKNIFLILDILKKFSLPLCLDIQDKKLLIKTLKRREIFIINSSPPEEKSLKFYLELSNKFNTSLVVLSDFPKKVSTNLDERKKIIEKIVNTLNKNKFSLDRIFIDVVILPYRFFPYYLYTPSLLAYWIKSNFSSLNILAGLDNLTYKEFNPFLKRYCYLILSSWVNAFITSSPLLIK